MAGGARLYEPLFGRLLSGMRRGAWELCPPRPGLVVLDVGCGTGAFLGPYAAAGCRVVGVDSSGEMLGEARRRLGAGALLMHGEAGVLPLASGTADLVVAMMLFHALAEGERGAALAEMARVAGVSGRVLVADHRPARATGIGPRLARGAARVIESAAGHGAGVRSLVAGGGMRALAAAGGLEAEASRTAAGGALEVVLLRRAGVVA
jgi:ubiquinone/menaquinone biosynthesis C-methylase UbiE